MKKLQSKDIPLQEIVLRRFELPYGMDDRELARKFLLSLGLLQTGESRDIIVDLFLILLKSKKNTLPKDINFFVNQLKDLPGASKPNLLRQLKRLRDIKLVEKVQQGYRITEFGRLDNIVSNYITPFIVNQTIERVREYAKEIDRRWKNYSELLK